jgi:bifunctional DNA-binding transcriptional regulator/antitoxin component of YhaV-PrlF toxin-antitoxin module|tara:strand:+ start:125 stop:283 length:159 start_codon:yes stop_codon:yes gene_type:complete
MKLQKQKTRKDKDYSKYVIVIPTEKIKQSGFKEGDELEAQASKDKIIIKKRI